VLLADLLDSASIGNKYALFEPIHGSYPQATGKGIANPIASILSAAMLLDHFGLSEEAENVRNSVERAIDLEICTPDLNTDGGYSTENVGTFIEEFIANNDVLHINSGNIKAGQSTII
jgi:3-isopropylmalate dehydrogenase